MPPFACACSIVLLRRRCGAVTDVARHGAEALTHKTINYVRTPLTSSGTAWARRAGFAFSWEARPRRSRFRPGSTPGRTGFPLAWVPCPGSDGIAICMGRAGRDCALRGSCRTRFPLAWFSRPWPDGIRLCVAAPPTQVAFPSGRRPRPDGIFTCVGGSPTQLAIPSDGPTQLQKPSDSSRKIHATRYPVRIRPRNLLSRQGPPTQLAIPSGSAGEGCGAAEEGRDRPPARPPPHGSGGEGMGRWDGLADQNVHVSMSVIV